MDLENKQAAAVNAGLMQRRRFRIRDRIAIGYLLTFVLTFGTTIYAMVFISGLAQEQRFLENARNFEFEIQQARRFEKDYFLHNTNLMDALYHAQNARSVLTFFKDDMRRILGADAFENISGKLSLYEGSLQELVALGSRMDSTAARTRKEVEPGLRRASAGIVTDYLEAVDRERSQVRDSISSSRVTAILGLFLVLALQIAMAGFVISHVLRPFRRFEKYFHRIAGGDFSPITPVRRYRDEFSDLAVAVNYMLRELKKQQEQIAHSRKIAAMGTLTAGIAHELNNPLNNVNVTIESLLDGFGELTDGKKVKLLRDAFGQARRAGDIVKRLLDFSRYRETAFEKTSVTEAIEISVKLVGNEVALNNIRFVLDLGNRLPDVMADRNKLQQVFINVFLNAIQAMPDGGEIRITSYLDDGYLRVDISDTGEGMTPEVLDRIFDPFFSTKDLGKGTGLGLSVAYGIMKDHNGFIAAKSAPGKGTTFSVKLPVLKEPTIESRGDAI
jgi:two-component system NtrC family sensor kinase